MFTLTLPLPNSWFPSFRFYKTQAEIDAARKKTSKLFNLNPRWFIPVGFIILCIFIYLSLNHKQTSKIHGVEVVFEFPKKMPSINASSLEEKEGRAYQIIQEIMQSGNFHPSDEDLLLLMEVARETNDKDLKDLILSIIAAPIAMLAEMFAQGVLEVQDDFSVEVVLFWLIHLHGLETPEGIAFFLENDAIINQMAQAGNELAQQMEELMLQTQNLIQSVFKPGFADTALVTFEEMARLVIKVANDVELRKGEAEEVFKKFKDFIEGEKRVNGN